MLYSLPRPNCNEDTVSNDDQADNQANELAHLRIENATLRERLKLREAQSLPHIPLRAPVIFGVAAALEPMPIVNLPFATLIEALDEGITLHDLDGRLLYASSSALRNLGMIPGELIGRGFLELAHPEDHAQLIADLHTMVQHGQTIETEWRCLHKNGSYIWFSTRTMALTDPAGTPYRLLCASHDISHRKQAEQELVRTHSMLEGLLDHLPVAVTVTDRQGRYILANRYIVQSLGLQHEQQMLGLTTADFFGPQAAARSQAEHAQLYREREPLLREYTVTLPDGSSRHALAISFPMFDSAEEVYSIGTIATDVTSLKQAEAALRDSDQRFRSLWKHISDAMAMSDADGKIVAANPAYYRLYGFTPEQVIGQPFTTIFPAELRASIYENYQTVFRSGEASQPVERTVRRANGEERIVETRTDFITIDGQHRLLLSTSQDITERRRIELEGLQIERKIRESQRLESLGVMAGGLAHDFNNILAGVIGYAELLLVDRAIVEEARTSVQAILSGAKRAAELTSQMLAYSGRGRFLVGRLALNDLLRQMGELIRVAVAGRAGLAYYLSSDPRLVDGDSSQLRQLVLNLVANAAEALDLKGGGVITISTGVERLPSTRLLDMMLGEDRPTGDYVRLSVSDDGPGIASEVLPHIFEPFFSTHFIGRGLGLAAVQGIVRAHSGAIEVLTTPGHGSIFKIYLPALEPDAGRNIP